MDKVIHFEIPADDLSRAQRFYKEIFGWQITQWPGEGAEPYYMVTTVESDEKGMPKTPGAINGGLMRRQGRDDAPVIVIKVSAIEDYLKEIDEAGGKVVLSKMKVGNMDLYARFADPKGNVIGLWQDLK